MVLNFSEIWYFTGIFKEPGLNLLDPDKQNLISKLKISGGFVLDFAKARKLQNILKYPKKDPRQGS